MSTKTRVVLISVTTIATLIALLLVHYGIIK